jgi:hypothetical protein
MSIVGGKLKFKNQSNEKIILSKPKKAKKDEDDDIIALNEQIKSKKIVVNPVT